MKPRNRRERRKGRKQRNETPTLQQRRIAKRYRQRRARKLTRKSNLKRPSKTRNKTMQLSQRRGNQATDKATSLLIRAISKKRRSRKTNR